MHFKTLSYIYIYTYAKIVLLHHMYYINIILVLYTLNILYLYIILYILYRT